MRTSAIITDSAYRSFAELRIERKKRSISAQTIREVKRVACFVLIVPVTFFLVFYFAFHMTLLMAVVISLLWLVSFAIASYLFYRGAVSTATRRPTTPSFRAPRDYVIEDGWLVERMADVEKRVALSRIVELKVVPAASLLDFGELGLIYLPFGSATGDQSQREFLEAIKSWVPGA